jgi:hypothetical protein
MSFLPHYLAQSDCLAADRQDQGDTRLTLTPSGIPNSNYVIMICDWNWLKIFFRVSYCNHQVHRDLWITLYNDKLRRVRVTILLWEAITVSSSEGVFLPVFIDCAKRTRGIILLSVVSLAVSCWDCITSMWDGRINEFGTLVEWLQGKNWVPGVKPVSVSLCPLKCPSLTAPN